MAKLKRIEQAYLFVAALILALLLCGWRIANTGFVYCAKFPITSSAVDALKCGNYHFGVYGPSGYDVVKAEYYFGRAVEIDSKTPYAWHQYARTAFLRGDFTLALYRINRQFEERGDELVASYYIRGLTEGYAKNYPAAEKDFLHFLEYDPYNWAGNNDLAWIYFAQGKFKEAASQTGKVLIGTPNNPWVLTAHAMSVYNLGDSTTALAELLRAKREAEKLTEEDWSRAYPGNNPNVAEKGLEAFRKTIDQNIALVNRSISKN